MDAVPILGGHHRHGGDGEVLVELVKGVAGPATAAGDHGGGRFVEEQPLGVVEHPVQQALQPPRDAAEIDWGAHHQAVGLDDLLDALIDAVIVENTAALAPAGSAVDTPPDELIADPEDLGLDLMLLELSRHLGQGGVGAALFVGATVDEQDFHTYLLLWAS